MDIRIEYQCTVLCSVKVKKILGKNSKTVFDWILGLAKKRQSSKKDKRPLCSSYIPAAKYSRLSKDEGKVGFCSILNKG